VIHNLEKVEGKKGGMSTEGAAYPYTGRGNNSGSEKRAKT